MSTSYPAQWKRMQDDPAACRDRAERMLELYLAGWTLEAIAWMESPHRVTRERVRQIIDQLGLTEEIKLFRRKLALVRADEICETIRSDPTMTSVAQACRAAGIRDASDVTREVLVSRFRPGSLARLFRLRERARRRAELIQLLQSMASELGRTPTWPEASRGGAHQKFVYGIFGSYPALCRAAGLAARRRGGNRVQRGAARNQLREEIARLIGDRPLTAEEIRARLGTPVRPRSIHAAVRALVLDGSVRALPVPNRFGRGRPVLRYEKRVESTATPTATDKRDGA